MIQLAGKYADVRAPGAPVQTSGRGPAILVPRFKKGINLQEWFWRELRYGGGLQRYMDAEKHKAPERLRAVAREMHGFQQNNKSDFRLLAAVPARDYFRWRREDPHFWEDNKNLKSYRRDNPDASVYL